MLFESEHPQQVTSKQNIIALVFFLYLFPIVLLTIYCLSIMPSNSSWGVFSIGLFGGILGSICFFWVLQNWSKTLSPQVSNQAPIHSNDHEQLLVKINTQSEDLQRIRQESEQGQVRVQSALQELETYKERSNSELRQREELLKECQSTLLEQRSLIEKQQHKISQLETRERELSFEVKTLLQLTKS